MMLLWLSFIPLLLNCKAQTTTVAILGQNNVSFVEEGSNLNLTCEVTNLNGRVLKWYHNEDEIGLLTNGDNIVFLDGYVESKYSLTGATSQGGNFTFNIYNITLDDIGQITCEVGGVEPAHHLVEVVKYPDTLKIIVNGDQVFLNENFQPSTFNTGSDDWLNMTCIVPNTRPAATIKWFINDTAISTLLTVNGITNSEEVITERMDLFTSISNFFLRPGFFQSPIGFYSSNQTENEIELNTTSSRNLVNELTKPAFQNNLEFPLVFACQAEVKNRNFTSLLYLNIGRKKFSPSSAKRPSHTRLFLQFLPFFIGILSSRSL